MPRKTITQTLATSEEPVDNLPVKKPSAKDKNSIFILRHGRTVLDDSKRSDGWLDMPLSDEGRTRLLTAQQYMKDVPVTRVYTPFLQRTMETAHIMESGMISHPDVMVAPDEAKTWNLGVFAGTQKKPNKPKILHFLEHTDDAPEGGESYDAFRKRFWGWFEKIQKLAADGSGPILCVMSGSNIREISTKQTGNRETLDLEEGGLMEMTPNSKSETGWDAKVLFGGKDGNQENEWLS